MLKSLKIRSFLSLCCILLMAGIAAAHCGNCPGDKKKCPVDCKKACCAKADEKKACSPDCEKACCSKAKESCPADCKKECCANGEKKPCCGKDGKCCKVADSIRIGSVAPDFTATDINGKTVKLSQFKEKIVVLEWTNYDCPFVKPHYKADVMTMSNLAKKYKGKGVVWLTVNSTYYATAEANKKWAKEKKLKQTVIVDSDGKLGKLFKATNTPQMYIVDKEGKLAYTGVVDNAPQGKKPESGYVNYVDVALAELTAGKKVSISKTKLYGCTVKYAKK